MANNISGGGFLSGLGSFTTAITNAFNLLVTKILGFTYGPGGGGSGYYTTTISTLFNGSLIVQALPSNNSPSILFSVDNEPGWIAGARLPYGFYSNTVYFKNKFYFSMYDFDGNSGIWSTNNGYSYEKNEIFPYSTSSSYLVSSDEIMLIVKNSSIYSTTDGISWSESFNLPGYTFTLIEKINEFFIATASGGSLSSLRTYYSLDGINWLQIQTTYASSKIKYLNEGSVYFSYGIQAAEYSYDLLSWNTAFTTSSFALPSNVIYSDETYIIPAGEGGFYYSTNLTSWTQELVPLQSVNSVTKNDGTWVVAGIENFPPTGNSLYYSTDLDTWTGVSLNNMFVQGLISNNGTTVAYGNVRDTSNPGNFLYYSYNATIWYIADSFATAAPNSFLRFNNFILENGLFVGQAQMDTNLLDAAKIYSADGVNWEHIEYPFFGQFPPATGTILKTVEIQTAIGNQGEEGAEILAPVDVYTVPATKTADIDQVTVKNNSTNTITYDLAVLSAGVALTDLNATINDQAISAGSTVTISNIASPMTFGQRIVVFPSAVDVVEVKVFGTETQLSLFVALGANSGYYSIDGITWTLTTSPAFRTTFHFNPWIAMTYGNGKFVALGNGTNRVIHSTDGVNWILNYLPISRQWTSLTYGNGKFVAVAYNTASAIYSTDGITWTESTIGQGNWTSVTYGNGKFVAIADITNLEEATAGAYSTDGITWTTITFPEAHRWIEATYGNGKFVIVGGFISNAAAYSTDGITWSQTTLPSSQYWTSLTYGNGKFVAVAYNTASAIYSTDGITWTESTIGQGNWSWSSVTYGNGRFVAIAGPSFSFFDELPANAAYSTDGITWTETTAPLFLFSRAWSTVVYG